MTVTTTIRRNDYTGNGATATYDFNFPIVAETDLVVTTATTAGVETVLVLTTNYTVDIDDDMTGSVTLTAGSLTSGYLITIQGVLPITQPTSIKNQGPYFPSVIEAALDRQTMIIQQQQEELDRCVKGASTDTAALTLPAAATRASKYFGFDSDGDPVAIASAVSTTGVSVYAATLLDDTTASAARDTLGFTSGLLTKSLLAEAALYLTHLHKTASYTVLGSDQYLTCDASGGAFTFTLPAVASNRGKRLLFKRLETTFANQVTIARAGSDTIFDGDSLLTSTTLCTKGEVLELVADNTTGSVWYVVNRHIPGITTAWTPTGSWVANTTYTGIWRREGETFCAEVKLALAGAPTAATLTITLPTGLTIDTAKLVAGTGGTENLGLATYFDTGTATYLSNPVAYSSTTAIQPKVLSVSGALVVSAAVNATSPHTWANTDIAIINFKVPITGWQG